MTDDTKAERHDPDIRGVRDAYWRVLQTSRERDRTQKLADTPLRTVIAFPASVTGAAAAAFLLGVTFVVPPAPVHPVLAWTLATVGLAAAIFGTTWITRSRTEWRAAPGRLAALEADATDAHHEWKEAEDLLDGRHPSFADTGEIELLMEASK